jgi:bacillithiol biosynthesis cysteine-adding enzyme BshC
MEKTNVPYSKTGYFSNLMEDYISGDVKLAPFIQNEFSLEGFKEQIDQKQISIESRKVLQKTLEEQYGELMISDTLKSNLNLLAEEETYTVTTGHQLNLFTGPLYFVYKIVSTINLAKSLKQKFPQQNFVPVFWMASEDHDFEEISHFSLFGQKHQIEQFDTGAVGRMKLEGIESVFNHLQDTVADRTGLESIIETLNKYYTADNTFAQAIRGVVNEMFGEHGLVILDGDNSSLKSLFSSYVKEELIEKKNHTYINSSSDKLAELNYKKQVNPREINLFYLIDNIRERIVFEEGKYWVINTEIVFSEDEIMAELEQFPERFSPNAVLRPLYQEVILPNLAYIGGGGELAYWFQLKTMFDANNVEFPVLGLRNSALIVDNGIQKKMRKLNLDKTFLFEPIDSVIKTYLKDGTDIILDLKTEEKIIENLFEDIVSKAGKIDQSLQPMIKSELQKGLKSLKNIENRLIKAEKQKEEVAINQIKSIKEKLFPKNSLQERKDNFLYLHLVLGKDFVMVLLDHLDPFDKEFSILEA